MLAVPQLLKSVAASGNTTVTIAVPNGVRALGIAILAQYAAVAGTSGVTASYQVSQDGGSTFAASKKGNITVAPAANVLGSAESLFTFQDDPYKADANPVTHVKVTLTNADATNAVLVGVLSENKNALGR